nr:unknown [Picosynechococcus sp. PCC 7002]
MNMETLEFIIYPEARVQEKVTGIVGSSCQEVTTAIEEQLGVVLFQEQTSEYFAQPVSLTATTNPVQSNW